MKEADGHPSDEAIRGLIRQLAQTEAALQQAVGSSVDTVMDPDTGAPILLRRTQAELRLLLEQLPAIVWATDLDLRLTSALGSGLASQGLASAEMVGRTLRDQAPEDASHAATLDAHRRALQGDGVGYEFEISGRTFQAHVEPLRGAGGQITGCLGVALDISRRARAEADLRRLGQELEERVQARTVELQGAYEELQAAHEELSVASEELQQQNEALAAARREVEAERQRYRDLFDFAPDGYLLTDPAGVIREANQAAAALLGVEQRFLTGKPLAAFARGDGFRTLTAALSALWSHPGPGPQRWEVRLQPRERRAFVAALSAVPVRDAEGGLQGLRWLMRDVSQRVEMEEALRASEERYRLVADFTYGWEYWIGPDGEYRYVSPSCQRVTGYSASEFMCDPGLVARLVHPEDRPLWDAHAQAEKSQEVRQIDFRVLTRSGEERWIAHACQPVYADDGTWLGWRGSNRDVTTEKQVERMLRENEQKLRALLEILPVGLSILDSERNVRFQNAALSRILDLSPEALREGRHGQRTYQRPDGSPMSPDEFPTARAVDEQRMIRDVEVGVVKEDGTLLWTNVSAAPLPFDDWRVIVVTADVTEKVTSWQRIEELAARARRRAEELDAVFEAMAEAVVVYDATGRPVRANRAALESYGADPVLVSREETARSLSIRHPDGRPVKAEDLPSSRALRGEQVSGQQFLFTNAQAQELTIVASASPLRADGQVTGAVAVWHDVSERERLLAEVQRQGQLLEQLIAAAPIGIAVVSGRDLRYELVNPAYRAISGTPDVPMVGRTFAEVFPHVHARGGAELFQQAFDTKEAVHARERALPMGPDGKKTYWNVDIVPLRRADGSVERALILSHEITDQVLDRQRIEEISAESQRRADELDAVFDAMTDAVLVYDDQGKMLKANRAAVAGYGFDPVGLRREELGARISARYPDGRPVPADEYLSDRAVRGETVRDQPYLMAGAQGMDLHVLTSAAPLRHGGQNVGAVVAWRDVTRQVEAERDRDRLIAVQQETMADLETERARLRAIFDSAPEGIVVADAEARILLTNPVADSLYARPVPFGEPYSSHAALHLHYPHGPAYDPRGLPLTRSALDGEVVREEEVDIVWPDGQRRHLLVNTAPIHTSEGQIGGAVGVFQDMTERRRLAEALREAHDELERRVEQRTAELVRLTENLRAEILVRQQAEQELRASEERFRQMAETINEVFMLVDPAVPRFLYLSPAFETLWGRPRQAVYEQPTAFLDGVLPEDRERLVAAWGAQAAGLDDEFRIQRPDGARRWMRLRAFAIRDQDGAVQRLACVAQDITTEKRAQATLIQAERLSMAGQLAASLAHEINNPIQSALGCLDLAVETLAEGDDPRGYLEVTTEALVRAAQVVSQLRSMYRESRTEVRDAIEIGALLEKVLLLTRKQCETAAVEVELQVAEPLPTLTVMVDGMQQVFLNLVLNAVEAMPHGGRLAVQAVATDDPPGVSVRFADSGGGMPPEILDRLFEPFYTTKEEGLGLGLFVSQGIVRQHGGLIDADSRLGEGTTLTVWLPAEDTAGEPS